MTTLLYSNTIKVYHDGSQACDHEHTPLNGWKLDIMHYLTTLSRNARYRHFFQGNREAGK